MPKQRSGPVAWIALVLTAVAVVALTTLLVVQATRPTKYSISAREQAAMDAAAQDQLNETTLTRKNFDADWARALKGVSGATLSTLTPLKASTLKTMTDAKADLSSTISNVSLESSNADTVVVLLAFKGYKTDDSGTKTNTSVNRLELAMKQTNGLWTIDDTTVIGV